SYGDVVGAQLNEGRLMSTGVIVRGGHSTYHLLLEPNSPDDAFEQAWGGLRAIGCSYERFSPRFVGVDVPPETDIHDAYRLFAQGQESGVWLFDEAHCGHPIE